MRSLRLAVAAAFFVALPLLALADPPRSRVVTTERICDLIERQAVANRLPKAFFARLIFKESRFRTDAVSPAGAEGIAQFMPGTARLRGLADSFDPEQALAASAAYLAELRARFGNLGLAAAAYNAGENRVERWLASGGFLPLETEAYVLDITGEGPDAFAARTHEPSIPPLQAGRSFASACRDLPAVEVASTPMSAVLRSPWAVQVAGNFRRSAAVRQFDRLAGRAAALLAGREPVVSRLRSPLGRRGIYAVRLGAASRVEADQLCVAVRRAGGSCVVRVNR